MAIASTRFMRFFVLAVMLVAVGTLTSPGWWRAQAPTPNLDQIRALARASEFRPAQTLLARYLQMYPKADRAHLLMAQLATEPTNSTPEVALEHLSAVRNGDPKQSALLKFLEGKAHYHQRRYDLAEACWTEALRLDPVVPEAGWVLFDLLDKEGRTDEAHRLGIHLHEVEPDSGDRFRILLELARLDIEAPDPLSQVELFEPLVRQHPECLPLDLSVGLALIRVNRTEDGLRCLHAALEGHSDAPEVWDAWLSGLYHASDADRLVGEFARLPKRLIADPRFAKHEGMIAQLTRNWPDAIGAYQRAFAYEPYNWGVCYRLRFALKQTAEAAEFGRIDQLYANYKVAYKLMRGSYYERLGTENTSRPLGTDVSQQRGAYYETVSVKTLGHVPNAELYQKLADLREKMGRFDEARAWHRLVLRDFPGNVLSLAALERLR
jgi:tetratricopeptide (TPR) repeat protein